MQLHATAFFHVLFPKLKSPQQEADIYLEFIHSMTEKCKFWKAAVQVEDNTYLLPWHPSLLLTSRCRSPSKSDFSSGENESGSSTFCEKKKYETFNYRSVNTGFSQSRLHSSSFQRKQEFNKQGERKCSYHQDPYHGERHPVDLVLIFGFVLSERTVTVEIRKCTNKCKAIT